MQRPLSWLRAIHNYRAEVAGAPNFAFDLCTQRFRPDQVKDFDLSCWKVAFSAAEPVRADTIERFTTTFRPYGFDPRAIHPLYGLAEATVLVSSGRRGGGPLIHEISREALQRQRIAAPASSADTARVVGCGRNIVGQRIAIVDPDSLRRLGVDRIGEVWVNGPHVCKGYWCNPSATRATFEARIEGEDKKSWLRTATSDFMDPAGELFITGRIKDVIIVRGNNHYPHDIEDTVYNSHPALRRHCGAVFSTLSDNEEKVVLVQEVERSQRHRLEVDEITACIREAVANEHEIAIDAIVLIRPGGLPKTTSGRFSEALRDGFGCRISLSKGANSALLIQFPQAHKSERATIMTSQQESGYGLASPHRGEIPACRAGLRRFVFSEGHRGAHRHRAALRRADRIA